MSSDSNSMPAWHGTTILSVRRGGKVVVIGDGQVSMGQTVMKPNARKVRRLGADGKVIGKDVDYLPDVGIILETPGFIGYYSGLQNLKVLAGIRHKIGQEKIRNTMCTVGLDPDLKLPVKKYSLGMRQRLGLAQAIMEEPSVLILDEPMNGLDRRGVEEIRSLLLSLKARNKLIVIASHNAEDIKVLCDRVYEMDNGIIQKSN